MELRARLVGTAGLLAIPPPTPLVDGWLYADSIAWLGGKPGHGKTFVAVELACCVGTGTPWHGHDVTQGRVLYLIAEGASGLAQRVDAWALAQRRTGRQRAVPARAGPADGDDVDVAALRRNCSTSFDPSLVILDTQARVTVGAEENSSRDMGKFVDDARRPAPAVRARASSSSTTSHATARTCAARPRSKAQPPRSCASPRTATVVELSNPKQKDTPNRRRSCSRSHPIGDVARFCPTRPWESPDSRPNPSATS